MRNLLRATALLTALATSASLVSAEPLARRGGYAYQPATGNIFRDREGFYAQQRRDGFFSQPFGQNGTLRWNTPHANGGLGIPNGGGGGSP